MTRNRRGHVPFLSCHIENNTRSKDLIAMLALGRNLFEGKGAATWFAASIPFGARKHTTSPLTVMCDEEQTELMGEKRPPIDYLFRVRDDLDMILRRKPKAVDLIYDACEAALPHVCAAIGHLDSTPPNQNDRRNEQPLRNFEEMFKLPKERANDLHYKISEWLAGRSENERIAREVLRLIRNDLREAQGADDFVRLEIDEALRDICCAIGRLIPQSSSVHDLDEPI